MGHLDMEAVEWSIRNRMHEVGGLLLGKLLDIDTDACDSVRPCGNGHEARFLGRRPKKVVTALSPVTIRRAYYYCPDCRNGFFPKD